MQSQLEIKNEEIDKTNKDLRTSKYELNEQQLITENIKVTHEAQIQS